MFESVAIVLQIIDEHRERGLAPETGTPNRVPEIAQRGRERFAARGALLSKTFESRDYLLGAQFSGADIAVRYSCNWAAYTGQIAEHPALVDYYARLQQRPAFQRVFSS